MTYRKKLLLLASGASLMLSGCSNFQRVDADTSSVYAQAKTDEAAMGTPLPPAGTGRFVQTSGNFTTGAAIVDSHGAPLPGRLSGSASVVLASAAPLSLDQIANMLALRVGIPVVLSPDLTASAQGHAVPQPYSPGSPPGSASAAINNTLAAANGGMPAVSYPPLPSVSSGVSQLFSAPAGTMPVRYTGSLQGFLNQVADTFGVSWKFTNGEIQFYRDVTKTWTIASLPSAESMSSSSSASDALAAQASSGSSGGSAGGALSGSYSSKFSSTLSTDIWKDLISGVTQVVGSSGLVSEAESTGSITVTAPPEVLNVVQTYLNAQNQRLSRMVAVSVEVLTVTATRSDTNNLNLNAVFSKLASTGSYALNIGNAATSAAGVASGISSGTPGLAFGVLSPTSGVSGSNVLATALSSLGRVSTVYNSAVTTMNGVPAPLQVSHTQAYLASVSTYNLGGTTGGVQTQLTPGVVTTGVSFNVLPRVDPGQNGVLLQFSMTVSALVGQNGGFNTVSDNGSTLQLPDIESQQFTQQADLPSGSTVILAGYNQVDNALNRTGTGDPYNFFLGGGGTATHQHQIVILLLTPVSISTPELIKANET